jgi:membrane-bound lytic murein transglycosylase F
LNVATLVLGAAALTTAVGARQAAKPAAPASAPAEAAVTRQKKVTTKYDHLFKKYSKHFFGENFDWRIFKAQAMAESDLIPTARSHVGARGLMQLMPSTYAMIESTSPRYKAIDDPQSNIAAGISHDRGLWIVWGKQVAESDKVHFMFASYNAGDMTIIRARAVAKKSKLDPMEWESVVVVAPKVQRWRYKETLGYVTTIDKNLLIIPAPHHESDPSR